MIEGLKWWFGLTPLEKHRVKNERARAIIALRDARKRGDTRAIHDRSREAVMATCEALRRDA